MEITKKMLALNLKLISCCIVDKAKEYNDKVKIGQCGNTLLKELSLLTVYVETLRFINLGSDEMNVNTILWQEDNTIRIVFDSSPDLTDITINDTIKFTKSDNAVNNGTFNISKVGGLSDLLLAQDIDAITYQNDSTIRYSFNGSPDLSSIVVGDRLIATKSTNDSNNDDFRITAINDSSDTIDVTNLSRIDDEDDEASDSPALADIKRPIDFIEFDNTDRSDNTKDETGSSAIAITFNGNNRYTETDIDTILKHSRELCKSNQHAWIETN